MFGNKGEGLLQACISSSEINQKPTMHLRKEAKDSVGE